METKSGVDTLKLAERISVRTNVTDWVMLIPNIGVEFDIRSTNWNRWAVNLNLRGNFQTKHTFKPPFVYNYSEVKLEGRMYWRTHEATASGYYKHHTKIWDKFMSTRRMIPKHPKTTYYRGVYVAYTDCSFIFPELIEFFKHGHQGIIYSAGISYGIVRPLYGFQNGNSIDLEFGVAGGLGYTIYDVYEHNKYDNCYEHIAHNKRFLPVINELRLGLVYRLGKYPIQKKYRWRYDVDTEFRERMENEYQRRQDLAELRHRHDSLYKVVLGEFNHLYDSLATVNRQRYQEDVINPAAEEHMKQLESQNKLEKELTPVEKRLLKQEKKAARKAKKAEEAAAKAATVPEKKEVAPVAQPAAKPEDAPASEQATEPAKPEDTPANAPATDPASEPSDAATTESDSQKGGES